MKKIIISILTLSVLLGCTPEKTAENFDYLNEAKTFATLLTEAKYEECEQMFGDTVKAALPAVKLKETFEKTIYGCGQYTRISDVQTQYQDGFQIVKVFLEYTQRGVTTQLTFGENGKVEGIWFNYFAVPDESKPLPQNLEEVDVTVGEGDFILNGKITKTKGAQSAVAVVLVHGSGPQDMDETIFSTKPFRDIAWGLGVQGIDVLRYDKRTLVHGEKIDPTKFTVRQETIDDALLAADLLKQRGYEKIVLLGHSLGGMMVPRINEASNGAFAGAVILAGSTRTLTDIVIDQNNNNILLLSLDQQGAAQKQIEDEKQKLLSINGLSEEQLVKETVFGMPALYVKEMNSFDTYALAQKMDIPVLVLQGELDFQVFADKDYKLLQEAFAGNERAEFVLYSGLTHLFTKAPITQTNTVEDYKIKAEVEQKVIDDITVFVKKI